MITKYDKIFEIINLVKDYTIVCDSYELGSKYILDIIIKIIDNELDGNVLFLMNNLERFMYDFGKKLKNLANNELIEKKVQFELLSDFDSSIKKELDEFSTFLSSISLENFFLDNKIGLVVYNLSEALYLETNIIDDICKEQNAINLAIDFCDFSANVYNKDKYKHIPTDSFQIVNEDGELISFNILEKKLTISKYGYGKKEKI